MDKIKDNKMFFIIVGAIIVGVFTAIGILNISGYNEYYLSTDIVRGIKFDDGKLVVATRSDMVSVCAKQTQSTPSNDALCWVDTVDNKATISVYEYKTYHIWTKDVNGIITYYAKYNTRDGE